MTVLEARGVESDAELAFAGLFDLFRPLDDEDLTRITQDLAADQRHDLLRPAPRRPAGRGRAVRDLHRGAAHPLLGRGAAARAGLRGRRAVAGPGVRGRHPVRGPSGPARPGGRAARRPRRRRAARSCAASRSSQLRGLDARGLRASCSARRPASRWRTRSSAGWPRRPGGNPLALIELSRDLDRRTWSSGTRRAAAPRRSATELFRDRLRTLDEAARAALVLLALDTGGPPGAGLAGGRAAGAGRDRVRTPRAGLAGRLPDRRAAPGAPADPVRGAGRGAAADDPQPGTGPGRTSSVRRASCARPGPGTWRRPRSARTRRRPTRSTWPATEASRISAYGTAAVALHRAAQLTADDALRGDRLLRAGVAARLAGRPEQAVRLLDQAAGCPGRRR